MAPADCSELSPYPTPSMNPRIRRLPEAMASQIAAGEVVQRPASVVKELMENALDAGAARIQVLLRDAGKTLIQVVDDGCGMGPEDARLCFERHATSKISAIEDLFSLRTMGFRGEALAAIASVARVELRTRRPEDELGQRVVVDAARLELEEPCEAATGTSIAVHHLFYNVPARRNFLRGTQSEMRRVVEAFQRIALAYPDIQFHLEHNGIELFQLRPGNARQRVVALLGKGANERLVPVSEQSPLLTIEGFVGKPDGARKTRGEQYLYLNGRFFRSPYLLHAVQSCYEKLIPEKHFPLSVLFLEMDPAQADVNVHPTKEEIRFEDERALYLVIQAAVRHALSRYSAAPTLDFDTDPQWRDLEAFRRPLRKGEDGTLQGSRPGGGVSGQAGGSLGASMQRGPGGAQPWEELFQIAARERAGNAESERVAEPGSVSLVRRTESGSGNWEGELGALSPPDAASGMFQAPAFLEEESLAENSLVQLHRRYLLCSVPGGLLLVDQRAAHERILFEKYQARLAAGAGSSQRQLFPSTLELSEADASLLSELLPAINLLGFDIQPFGPRSFVVHGFPADCREMDEKLAVDELLESFRSLGELGQLSPRDKVARSLARTYAIPHGRELPAAAMRELLIQLGTCRTPYAAPDGSPLWWMLELDEIGRRMKRRS
jgi:DNA mismatch repair protein MutL